MIVKDVRALIGSDCDVKSEGWNSVRLVVAEDNMGFSLNDAIIEAGASLDLCYRNHLEAGYCIEGRGTLINKETGERFGIYPGVVYALNNHEQHRLVAQERLRIICVLNPSLHGQEMLDQSGSYPDSGKSIAV